MSGRRALLKKEMVTDVNMLDKDKYTVPKIVIAIDGYQKINELEVNLLDEFIRMIRDSASLGIHFIISSSTYKEVKENLKQFIANRVILFCNDKYDVTDSIGRTDYDMQEVAGRALVKLEKPEVMQMYYPVNSAENFEYSELLLNEIKVVNEANAHQNEAIKEMPEVVENKDYKSDGTKLNIGISYEDIEEFKIPLDSTLIVGEPKRGKTNFMQLILEQSLHLFGSVLVIDSIKQELVSYKTKNNVEYIGSIDEITNVDFSIEYDAIVINKLDLIEQLISKEQKKAYEQLGMQMLTGTKIFMEISESIGNSNRLFKQIKKATNIIIMQSLNSQKIVPITDSSIKKIILPSNSSFVFVDRQLNMVKQPHVISNVETRTDVSRQHTTKIVKKKTNNLNINGKTIRIDDMVIANSVGTHALQYAIESVSNTEYNVISNLDEKYTLENDVQQITSYSNMLYADKTIFLLDPQKLANLSRDARIKFLEDLERNDANDFYIWLVSFGEGRISNKFLKSIVKKKYGLISGGFENNTVFNSSSIRNYDNKIANGNLVLLDGNKLTLIKER